MAQEYQPALNNGRAYLIQCLQQDRLSDQWYGAPSGFPLKTRSVLSAYFICRALVATGGVEKREKIAIERILEHARKGVAYGYSIESPVDADDTAFAFRIRRLLGHAVSASEFDDALKRFRYRSSWKTFDMEPNRPLVWHTTYDGDDSIIGLHPEVHLNVVTALVELGRDVRCNFEQLPIKDGLWGSYHYFSNQYATWLLTECGCLSAKKDCLSAIEVRIIDLQQADGGWKGVSEGWNRIQETALSLLSISDQSLDGENGRRGLAFLKKKQRPDGSWDGGWLWTYHPPNTNGKCQIRSSDTNRIVSTSLAVMALSRANHKH